MAQVTIGDAHGLSKVFIGLVTTEGYHIGQNAEIPADGTLMTPYLSLYAKEAGFSLPSRNPTDFTGGDRWTGSYVYGITTLGAFELQLSTTEAELIALTSSSAIDQTQNTRQTIFADNIILPTPPQACMMIVFNLQSKEVGSVGGNKYISLILPRVWLSPEGIQGAPSFQAAGSYKFQVITTISDRMPYGPLFSTTDLNLFDNVTPNYYVITDNPPHFVTFTAAAGATETVTLPYKPISFDYSTPDSGTQPVQCYVNGVQVDATTINATTGAVTITQAFTGGEIIGIFYETNYVPTA